MIIADLMAVSDGMSIILLQKRSFFVAAVAFTVWYILIFRDYRKITKVCSGCRSRCFFMLRRRCCRSPIRGSLLVGTFVPHVSSTGLIT